MTDILGRELKAGDIVVCRETDEQGSRVVAKIDAVYHEVGRMSVDAVVFLKTVNRMCSQFENCDQCPIYGLVCACASKDGKENTVVERVEKWAKEHPVKTRLSDFLEKYPNAPLGIEGVPEACASQLGYNEPSGCAEGMSCVQCWNIPIE